MVFTLKPEQEIVFRVKCRPTPIDQWPILPSDHLDFDKEDAKQAGEIRAVLASIGKSIGPYDVLIAGQAKARNLVLIIHNTKEFMRVKNLHIEDWEKGQS